MAKSRSRITDFLIYLAVRVVVAMLQILSLRAACTLAAGLGWLLYHVDRRHRQIADDNLRHAFPDMGVAARNRMVRAVYRHFCLVLIEIVFMPRRIHVTNWKQHFHMVAPAPYVEAILSGRPMLCVTGHFGNWEVSGYSVSMLGFQLHAIARPLDNPYVDDFLRSLRERTGQKILAKKGDFDKMDQVLASGGLVATLADQDAGQRGLFVDFFGRPASTHKAVALMALEHGVLMVVAGAYRVGAPLEYHSAVEDIIDPEDYRGHPDPVRAITVRFTTALERLVRRRPEQYFWVHRRWKHQPHAKKSRAA